MKSSIATLVPPGSAPNLLPDRRSPLEIWNCLIHHLWGGMLHFLPGSRLLAEMLLILVNETLHLVQVGLWPNGFYLCLKLAMELKIMDYLDSQLGEVLSDLNYKAYSCKYLLKFDSDEFFRRVRAEDESKIVLAGLDHIK